MSFKSALHVSGERCDKCNKEMTVDNPGIELKVRCRETGLSIIWIHLSELPPLIARAEKELKNLTQDIAV